MARFASTFPRYEEMVVEVYRSASRNTLPRARLEAAARGTKLYAKLKAIDLDAERADLFNNFQPKNHNTSYRTWPRWARHIKFLIAIRFLS
jgi:hypothetical protein